MVDMGSFHTNRNSKGHAGSGQKAPIIRELKRKASSKDAPSSADSKWLNNPDALFDWLEHHVENKTSADKPDGMSLNVNEIDPKALIRHARHLLKEATTRLNTLEGESTLDPLTGLVNRHGFFQTFLKEMDSTKRSFSTGGLLFMIELENHDNILEMLGQSAVDHALKTLGQALHKDIRTMDTAARLADGEFIVLFPHTKRNAALERAQHMAWKLNQLKLNWQNVEYPMNISLGMREFTAGDDVKDILYPSLHKENGHA